MTEYPKTRSERLTRFILDRPVRSLLIAFCLLVIFGSGIAVLKSDFSYRIWFHEGDPDLDEPGYKFGQHLFKVGEYVSLTEQDGELRTFRVVSVR